MITLTIYLFCHRRTYDIIHVHQALYPAFVSLLIGKGILKKPVLIKTASTGITSDIIQLKRFPLGKLQLAYLLKNMDCLITVSETGRKEYEALGLSENKIRNIPNGVRIPKTQKTQYDTMINVLASARLSREKGMDILLKAWTRITKQIHDVKLFILGEGPLQSDLKTLSSTLGLNRSVFFGGAVQDIEVYLREADVFVLPSRTEGLSNALLEAMSFGIPCIATQVGETGQVLAGTNAIEILPGGCWAGEYGILVNPEDDLGLSKAILYLIDNPKERERVGRRARVRIQEKYSIDSVAETYIGLYRSLLEEVKGVRTRLVKQNALT
jgi:glycosyltransferase involved in cell wall biosynthesis